MEKDAEDFTAGFLRNRQAFTLGGKPDAEGQGIFRAIKCPQIWRDPSQFQTSMSAKIPYIERQSKLFFWGLRENSFVNGEGPLRTAVMARR
jgi:hypothetical protein